MSNKKINPDNLSRVNGAFKDMDLGSNKESETALFCVIIDIDFVV